LIFAGSLADLGGDIDSEGSILGPAHEFDVLFHAAFGTRDSSLDLRYDVSFLEFGRSKVGYLAEKLLFIDAAAHVSESLTLERCLFDCGHDVAETEAREAADVGEHHGGISARFRAVLADIGDHGVVRATRRLDVSQRGIGPSTLDLQLKIGG